MLFDIFLVHVHKNAIATNLTQIFFCNYMCTWTFEAQKKVEMHHNIEIVTTLSRCLKIVVCFHFRATIIKNINVEARSPPPKKKTEWRKVEEAMNRMYLAFHWVLDITTLHLSPVCITFKKSICFTNPCMFVNSLTCIIIIIIIIIQILFLYSA